MNNAQNAKIEQVTDATLVVGVDIESYVQYARVSRIIYKIVVSKG